ncbi:MAG: DUF1667 domain-containing protein [Clostridiales bacterium]|nr:DUF1667 domain-containing protein [Clostridiales bacterium]
MAEMVCIVCPRGCRLTVDEASGAVTGNSCPRGEAYGRSEILDPRRVYTGTVRINGAALPRCPVKSSAPIKKPLIMDVSRQMDKVTLSSPVKRGDVAIKNVLGTGVDIIVTRDM